jgi:N-acetylglucosaminyldiphosphoundecaprenol N-acetyl-beta-D-mannosaminyltransferase
MQKRGPVRILSEDIVGYPVSPSGRDMLVAQVMAWIAGGEGGPCHYFACANPHAIEMAEHDPAFRKALVEADFLTPDGLGVVYASRLLGGDIRGRVTGMDIFLGTMAAMQAARGGRCFFLGSTEETLAAIRARAAVDFPAVEVVGTYSPPFRPEFTAADDAAMIEAVNASGAQVLWVGLTAPKQEKWVHAHRDRLAVAFAGPIGAAFDFYIGRIRRAGPAWQRAGLEWLPRLVQEPGRLWRRMGVSAPRFMARVVAARHRRQRLL